MQVNDKHQIKCGTINGNDRQKWRLFAHNGFYQLQNVFNSEFLHSTTKYVVVTNDHNVWEDNGSDLITAPQDFSDEQKWVFHFGGPPQLTWAHKNKALVQA